MSLFDRDMLREAKRSEIVKVAGGLFCTVGYRNISVEDIAREIGLTKTIIYYYFPNKHEIFKECHLQATSVLESAFEDAADPDPEKHLRRFVDFYVKRLLGDEGPGAVLLDLHLLPDADRAPIQVRRETVHAKLRALLEEMVEAGRIETVDAKLSVLVLMSAINVVPRWFRPGGDWSAQQVAEHCTRIFLSGLLSNARVG